MKRTVNLKMAGWADPGVPPNGLALTRGAHECAGVTGCSAVLDPMKEQREEERVAAGTLL